MANGYSLRRAMNYYKGIDGKWKLHSIAVSENGYTKKWATIEAAEEEAKKRLVLNHTIRSQQEEGYVVYIKIYNGNEFIKEVRI